MIAIIVAYSKNKVIGKAKKIPWKLLHEQKHFRELTLNHILIMGRKTFESIGRQLDNRITIVVSNTKVFSNDNLYTVNSFCDAIKLAKTISNNQKTIFICGGQKIYEKAISICEKMYVTEIDKTFQGDAYFPNFDDRAFTKKIIKKVADDIIPYTFFEYTKV